MSLFDYIEVDEELVRPSLREPFQSLLAPEVLSVRVVEQDGGQERTSRPMAFLDAINKELASQASSLSHRFFPLVKV